MNVIIKNNNYLVFKHEIYNLLLLENTISSNICHKVPPINGSVRARLAYRTVHTYLFTGH